MVVNSRADVYALLQELGASPRLLRHLALVGEAAALLIAALQNLGLDFDARLVELGAAVHDAGKILFPQELDAPGAEHELAGEQMLLARGVEAAVAHAAWQAPGCTLEERLVALADKLWKGKRESALELLVIDMAAARLGADRWSLYARLDEIFESIAAGGDQRLYRSRV